MEPTIETRSFERRLNTKDIEAITGKHRQTIWRWCTATPPQFPQPEYIGGRRSWTESQITEWLNNTVQTFDDRQYEVREGVIG